MGQFYSPLPTKVDQFCTPINKISGIDHYKGAFGGMGSINDLVLHPINGHTIKETEINSANEKLKVYFSTIGQLAEEVTKHAVFNE